MFSSTSSAEWTAVSASTKGDTFYVDFDRLRKHDGYIYYWVLLDHLEPKFGILSVKTYYQADCDLFRSKILSFITYKQPMGNGVIDETHNLKDPEWRYAVPKTVDEGILNSVCFL
jgi:hypothetical protein